MMHNTVRVINEQGPGEGFGSYIFDLENETVTSYQFDNSGHRKCTALNIAPAAFVCYILTNKERMVPILGR